MSLLARGSARDIPVVAGESGAAGLAGLLQVARHAEQRVALGLGAQSRVLLVNTEGASAPDLYRELVRESAAAVAAAQARWMAAAT